ncbi:YolD-like family protein [Bacillus salinus]|uniref:YolD-like family protein n=1 Tax=Bacillus sp. HMF5848 TaxID=2495421 RepID=UPI00163AC135|nr:YolD-like family protein [Bacillus sp. HMF5848]
MMLPEHKEEFVHHLAHIEKRKRPLLDEDKQQEIERALLDSYELQTPVTIVLFDEYHPITINGIVTKLDAYQQRITINDESIPVRDIIEVKS